VELLRRSEGNTSLEKVLSNESRASCRGTGEWSAERS
jgi:hypothetical protein